MALLRFRSAWLALVLLLIASPSFAQQSSFTLEQVLSAPFPTELTSAPNGAVAWVFDVAGARNVWVAAPPNYQARQVTSHKADDGQEITDLRWTTDGGRLVFVRGGPPNAKGEIPNPSLDPKGVEQAIWVLSTAAGTGNPRRIGEGSAPAVAPKGDRVAFVRKGQVWWASLG